MWMCDRCQEINDDNVTVCPKCGFANQTQGTPAAASLSTASFGAPPNLAGVTDYTGRADTDLNPTQVRSRILNRWEESGIAIKTCPVLILALIALLVVEALPVFTQGVVALIADIVGALFVGRCILKMWKLIYLRQHGVRALATVTDVGSRRAYQAGTVCQGIVEYKVNGVMQRACDRYGGGCSSYPRAGDQVPVLYDAKIPNFAEIELPQTQRGGIIFAGFAWGVLLYIFAWNVYAIWNSSQR